MESIKQVVHAELCNISRYRKKILRKLKTFGKHQVNKQSGFLLLHISFNFVSVITVLCLLAGMSEALLQAIAEQMEELVVETGFVIIEQGDRGDAFYVLKEGTASVTVCLFNIWQLFV